MQSHVSATFSQLNCAGGVCVVDGYGAHVRVYRRQLVVSDGIGRYRRERTFTKALADIKRLVILGHEGAITLEALRWLNDAGIAFLLIDRDGEVIASSARYGLDDPRLRRALALAQERPSGLEIARYVLTEKLKGQEKVITGKQFPGNARDIVAAAVNSALTATTMSELLLAESAGAAAYWGAWRDIPLRFAKQDEKRVPDYWRTFVQRGSPITGSPRLAANPANALLNYLYALLEAETRIACLACGLDPGLGIFHADLKARDSLVCDLMEAVRPRVDSYLLDLLERRTFTAKDFVETRKGVCRVLAPVTHILAETSQTWAKLIAPVVEHVCHILAAEPKSRIKNMPTLLTQSKRRTAVRRTGETKPATRAPRPVASCARCGGALPSPDRAVCDACLPERRDEQLAAFATSGPAALAQLRAEGRDPMNRAESRRKVGEANARRKREATEWERTHEKPDPEVFTREILPSLGDVSVRRMQRATGLSLRSCSRIKHGWVPHARHWDDLRCLET
jgi:CRISPR-associated endonuclease Cas1